MWRRFQPVWVPALRWHDCIARQSSGTRETSAAITTERLEEKPCEKRGRNATRTSGMAVDSNGSSNKGIELWDVVRGGWFVVSTGNRRKQRAR